MDKKAKKIGADHVHFAQAQTPTVPPNLPQYTNGPAVIENVKKLDFPGSKQGMQYARGKAAVEEVPALGPCPKGVKNCN